MPERKVIFIAGPTASGKTAVSLELAERAGGEIISSDSMQVYRGMDILTQAPRDEDLRRITHHLVKKIPPGEEYSAARFADEAGDIISDIIFRGKVPIVSGGTGLYMRSLLDGLFASPPKDGKFREELENVAREKGSGYLHDRLRRIDPETAGRLHPNDLRRIIRALEVYELTSMTIHDKKAEAEGISGAYDCVMFGLELERSLLYDRINKRVDKMFEEGIVDEVRRLLAEELSVTAGKALGIKEIKAFLEGEITLGEAREELKKNTRRYAKRQLTWFRADDRIIWVDADRSSSEVAEEVLGHI